MKLSIKPAVEDEIGLAPLIDCVFLLLVFLMLTASSRQPEQSSRAEEDVLELLLKLPTASGATHTQGSDAELVVGVDRQGDTYLDGDLVGRTTLHARLQAP